MAVLKHTSPTANPVAPRPWPAITVPSASTSRPVNGASSQGLGACVVMAIQPGGTCREFALLDGATGSVRLGPFDWARSTGPVRLGPFDWALFWALLLAPVVGPLVISLRLGLATGTCDWLSAPRCSMRGSRRSAPWGQPRLWRDAGRHTSAD